MKIYRVVCIVPWMLMGLLSSPALAQSDGRGCCSSHGGIGVCRADGTLVCDDGWEASACSCGIEVHISEVSTVPANSAGNESGEFDRSWDNGVESNDGNQTGETRNPSE